MEVADVVDAIETAPENLREFYVKQDDGKFKFDPAAATAGLKKNRNDILTEKERLAAKLAGVDVDEYRRLKAAEEDAKRKKQQDEGDWEAREKSLKDSFQAEKTTYEGKIVTMTKALEKTLVDAEVVGALSAAKGNIPVMKRHVRDYVQMTESNGEYVVRVVDDKGQVRFVNGVEMTIPQLVAEFKSKDEFKANFAAEAGSGSGAPNNVRRTPGAEADVFKIGNPTERLKAARRLPNR
jgi:hypothetical protein